MNQPTGRQQVLDTLCAERPELAALRTEQTSIWPLTEIFPGDGSTVFTDDCWYVSSRSTPQPRYSVVSIGAQREISGAVIWEDGQLLAGAVQFGRDNGLLVIENNASIARADIRLYRDAVVRFGPRTTANEVLIIVDDGSLTTGQDCMFSSGVTVQVGDQHTLWSIDDDFEQLNCDHIDLVLEDHVWIGRNATLLGGARLLGTGSIVGIGAMAASPVPPFSVAVGNPARVVRSGTTWSRNIGIFTRAETELLDIAGAPSFVKR